MFVISYSVCPCQPFPASSYYDIKWPQLKDPEFNLPETRPPAPAPLPRPEKVLDLWASVEQAVGGIPDRGGKDFFRQKSDAKKVDAATKKKRSSLLYRYSLAYSLLCLLDETMKNLFTLRLLCQKSTFGTTDAVWINSLDRTASIRHLCRKTTVLICHRCLINTA